MLILSLVVLHIVRFVLNFFISVGWLYLFNWLGWISIGEGMNFWLTLFLIALITAIVAYAVDLVIGFFLLATCGVGCFFYPLLLIAQGWLWLWIISELTGWLTINIPFLWLGLVMGFAYGLLRIHAIKFSYSRRVHHTYED